MKKFKQLTGLAAHFPVANVDTDMIIPKQFLKTLTREGLGKALFYERRYKQDGTDNPDFVLNQKPYTEAKILIAGENFGCGSSREHAAWALDDFGIRCVIAPSFADIFYGNCLQNGILPIVLPQAEIDKLLDDAARGANAMLDIDLVAQTIKGPDGGTIGFEIATDERHRLLEALDNIGRTLQHEDKITAFEAQRKAHAWL